MGFSRPATGSSAQPANEGMAPTLVGVVFVLLAITTWGVYFSFAIIVLRKLTAIEFLMFRWGIGVCTLLLLNLAIRKPLRVAKADWPVVASAIVIGIVVHQLLQVNGLKYTTSTNTGWILTTIPPITGALGWIFLRERLRVRQIVGLIIAMTGVTLFVTNGNLSEMSLGNNLGDLLVFGSVFTWSIYTILTKSRLGRYDALGISIVYMLWGFGTFILLKLFESGLQIPSLTTAEWLIMLGIGVFPSGLAYYWWNAGLQRLTAVNTSMFLFIEAIVASSVGALMLGDVFSTAMVGFALLIVIGVSVAQGVQARRRVRVDESV
ncbi:MAG: EamA family transporter [candidate division Zixibacteria bacterium]|nr:EamA family transporter [candidate division Zixibacteria bacterium]